MPKVSRDEAWANLVKSEDGLYHIPLLNGLGIPPKDVTFVNKKQIKKFYKASYGFYVLKKVGGRTVYEHSNEKFENQRRAAEQATKKKRMSKLHAFEKA